MRKWENEIEQYLIDNFHKKTISEIAAVLGRINIAVKNKALKLGLKKDNKHIWTEKEISYLKANTRKVLQTNKVNEIVDKSVVLVLKKIGKETEMSNKEIYETVLNRLQYLSETVEGNISNETHLSTLFFGW
jgi:hypothetical protein